MSSVMVLNLTYQPNGDAKIERRLKQEIKKFEPAQLMSVSLKQNLLLT